MADQFVELARKTITVFITTSEKVSPPDPLPAEMKTRAGVFVSIHNHGKLRGCIGTFSSTTESVAHEIIEMAIAASTSDPRFSPVIKSELDDIDIKVDVLNTPEPVKSINQLDHKKYGVIVRLGMRRGLLLPDLEGVDTVEEQIRIAMYKAGIPNGAKVDIERFEVIRHSE
ncbi:MAG: AmmeMemoRadiSam system protein A [Caldisericia bacterium]|nr:AmmeMemoRadiSam system protein A [Caldisericia bacterium]